MTLVSIDIEKLENTLSWLNGDTDELEDMLKFAGKGDAGDYEHFNLTLAIYHLNEAGNYIEKVIDNYEDRMSPAVKTEVIPAKSTSQSLVPMDTTSKVKTTNQTTTPKKDEDLTYIDGLIKEVMAEFPNEVEAHKKGEPGKLGFLTAQVVIRTNAKANTGTVFELLEHALEAD